MQKNISDDRLRTKNEVITRLMAHLNRNGISVKLDRIINLRQIIFHEISTMKKLTNKRA